MKEIEIVGMGLLARDLTVVVDRRPGPDEKVTAREYFESGGGPVPTALVTLSRLGRSVAMVGWVGEDPSGRLLVEELEDEGVDSSFVQVLPGMTTPVSVITVEGAHRSICEVGQGGVHPPDALEPELESRLAGCRFLLVDGRYPAPQIAASRVVRNRGGQVVLDAGRPRPRIDELLGVVDVAIVSHSYLEAVEWGAGGVAAFLRGLRRRLAGDGAGIAGVTLGAEGCAL